MDGEMDGMATGLSNAICRDGQSTTTARIPFASGLSAAAGSTSAAAYCQTNDPNTGLYFPAADQWGLAAGGTGTLTSTATALTATGTLAVSGAVTLSSSLDLTGNLAINTNKFTVTAASGNTSVAGTLAVTGAATLSAALTVSSGGAAITGNSTVTGTLGVSSDLAVNTNKFTVAASSGNTAVAGTLAVTGAATLSAGLTVSSGSVSLPSASVADSALATPGRWKLISSQTASSSATIDFNSSNASSAFDGTYDFLVVRLSKVKPATDDVELWIRTGTGAGPTYQSGAGTYEWLANGGTSGSSSFTVGSASDTKVSMCSTSATNAVGNASNEHLNGTVEFESPDAADSMPYQYRCNYIDSTGVLVLANGTGRYKTAAAVTAIRFLFESGNIASGTFSLYGIKNT